MDLLKLIPKSIQLAEHKIITRLPIKRNILYGIPEMDQWIEWLYETSLMSEVRFDMYKDTSIFAAYFHPDCDDKKKFENIVKYMVMFFVFDDHTETEQGDVSRDVLKCQELWSKFELMVDRVGGDHSIEMNDWKPYLLSMYAVFDSICKEYNDIQKKRFVEVWKSYAQGNIEETQWLSKNINFEKIDQILQIRRKSIAADPVLQIIEYADNISLSDEEWADTRVKNLFEVINDCNIFVNDVASYNREIKYFHDNMTANDSVKFKQDSKGENPRVINCINMVAFIAMKHGLSADEAKRRVIGMAEECEMKMIHLADIILRDENCSQDKRIFIEQALKFCGGSCISHSLLKRYLVK